MSYVAKRRPKLSFWRGFARGCSLDIFPARKPFPHQPRRREARDDAAALWSDWDAIGNDMRKVLAEFGSDDDKH